METVSVEIPEFREHLAQYLLTSQAPVAITNHGNTIGYFVPARRKRTEAEIAAFDEAAARMDEMLAAMGVTEDELMEDFKRLRAAKRK
jgi:antitoxin (DNA-binding transcriptional repressor) of toxin-antitoxin stability system